jgi:hypothetical protein
MNRAARKMALLERRPWTLALISATGVTLLVPSVLALYGPPELLDSAIALGDTRLALGLTGLFAVSSGTLRLLLRRRRLAEEQIDEETAPAESDAAHRPPATAPRAHLR